MPPEGHSRRALLQALAVSAVGATAGCSAFSDVSEETSTTTETTTETTATESTAERGYEKQPAQLETRWTSEVGPDNARPEYPRPQLVREEWANLNGVWQFAGAAEDASPPLGEELEERVLVPYPVESGLSGIKRHEPWIWYRRTFTVPAEWDVGSAASSRRLLLHFERVDWAATVYVNGEEVTSHRGGYDHFAVDMTDALVEEGPQELFVSVFDPTGLKTEPVGTQPKGRQGVDGGVTGLWKSSASGIWDTVWMEPVAEAHVARLDMTPDLDENRLRLTVDANTTDATVEAVALKDGQEAGTVSGPAGEELHLAIDDPRLWSPADPFLYDLEIRVRDAGGAVVDVVESYFGMRSLGMRTVDGTARPTLNGELYYHHGSLESGYWPDGGYTAPTDAAAVFNLEAQKELGFNMVRKHGKLETRRWFYHTDRLGLLVWQDIPNMDEELPDPGGAPPLHDTAAQEHFKTEVEAMVTELDTHPSLAVWTAFNEGWGVINSNLDYIREMTEFIADLDPERYAEAMSGHNVGSNRDSGAGDINDIHEYPGPDAPDPEPDRFSANGEYTSKPMHLPGHTVGRCAGTTNAETFVRGYIDTLEQLEDFVVSQRLGASVYTATTDLLGVCNGHITYDREVIKAARAEKGIERIRAAHESLYRTASLIEHANLGVDAPTAYDPGHGSAAPASFDVTATFTNPESPDSVAVTTEDVELGLWGVPDDWTSTSQTATAFDGVADGESVTATWVVTPETAEDAVELGVTATFRVDGETHEFVVDRELGEVQIARWSFDGTDTDSIEGYRLSLEGAAAYDAEVVAEGSHSLRLDGESGYALLSDFDSRPSFLHDAFRQRTVTTWIKPDTTTGRQVVYNEGGTVNGFGIRLNEGTLEASVANGNTVATAACSFDRTAWTHVAAVFDEGALRLYVDGEEAAANPDVGYDVVPSHVAGAEIGGSTTSTLWADGKAQFFGGNVDATGFYRTALDAEKIAALANTT